MLVYLADPLFSEAERRFNEELAEGLEAVGFRVFLPQRNGVEWDKLPTTPMTPEQRRLSLFRLDEAKIFESDLILFVLDGRAPDEGACVELGIAYCHKKLQDPGKLLVGLQTDVRAAFLGARLVAESEEMLLEFLRSPREPGGISG